MADVGTAAALAPVVTKLVDLMRNRLDRDDSLPKWWWQVAAFGVGIALAYFGDIDIFSEEAVGEDMARFLSGLVIAGGSSATHEILDLVSSIAKSADPPDRKRQRKLERIQREQERAPVRVRRRPRRPGPGGPAPRG